MPPLLLLNSAKIQLESSMILRSLSSSKSKKVNLIYFAIIHFLECRKCQSNVTEELERLFSSDVDKYTTNLSRLFYVSKLYFDQVSFISENPGEYLNRWHCVLSMMRVRNKKIDSDPLKLDVYFDEVLKK